MKLTRLLLISIILTAFALSSSAEKGYKITWLNSDRIVYKGHYCQVNDIIQDLKGIKWTSPKDAMRLKDLETHKTLKYSAKNKETKSKDSNGFVSVGNLSSRNLLELPELVKALSDITLYDVWECSTVFSTTDDRWFEITFETPGGPVTKQLVGTPSGDIFLTTDLFDGVKDKTIIATVKYVFAGGKQVLVSDKAKITIVPAEN